MQKQFIDLVKQYNDTMLASFKQLGELNMKTMERISSQQAETANLCMEATSKHLDKLAHVKDLNQALSLQTAYNQSCGEKMMANAREYAEMFEEVRVEFSDISETATSAVTEKMEAVGELLKDAA